MSSLRDFCASSSNSSILLYFRKNANASSSSAATPSTPPTSDPDVASIYSEATSKPQIKENQEPAPNAQTSPDLGTGIDRDNLSKPSLRQPARKIASGDQGLRSEDMPMNGEREEEAENHIMYDSIQVLDDWEVDALPDPHLGKERQAPAKLHRQRSESSGTATTVSDLVGKATSILGKRGRETMDSINDETQSMQRHRSIRSQSTELEETEEQEDEEDDEDDEDDDVDADSIIAPISKKARFSEEDGEIMALLEDDATPKKKRAAPKPRKPRAYKSIPYIPPNPFRPKTWLSQGLYVGQDPDFDPRLTETKNRLKRASMAVVPLKRRTVLPMPMFSGARMLEKGRDFRLPFDVYGPLPPGQPKPEEWKKVSKSASQKPYTGAVGRMLTIL